MREFAEKVKNGSPGKTCLFSLGQAGYIVKSRSGQLLGIDLYLSECVERVEGHVGFKRLLPELLSPGELTFDALIATHAHKDHFDDDSLPAMVAGHTRLFASVGCVNDVRRLGMAEADILYVKPGDRHICGDFTLEFIFCDHGRSAPDAVGVVVTVDGKKICETGDTCLRPDQFGEYAEKGPFDVLIAPINGMYGNMNAAECARLADALKPRVTVPCHYGMFASHGGSPGEFYRIMTGQYPENGFFLMAQGEELVLG